MLKEKVNEHWVVGSISSIDKHPKGLIGTDVGGTGLLELAIETVHKV